MSDEEYEFEYSDDEQPQDGPEADLENAYYTAKSLREEDPREAMRQLYAVAEAESDKGPWGFKALKQILKLLFVAKDYTKWLELYRQLLTYASEGYVTQNAGEKGINNVLEYVSAAQTTELLQQVYEETLSTLQGRMNDRLWFRTNLKLGHLLYNTGDTARLQKVVKQLLSHCEPQEGGAEGEIDSMTDVSRLSTQLLEVHALQMLMYSRQRDTMKLREIYQKAQRITAGIPHPRTLATILEAGGRMHMQEREWDLASPALFQSFKSYDEAGDPRRLQVLKYMVMASMLHQSNIDPFTSQETLPYKSHPEIVAMTRLVTAFRDDDIRSFERTLKTHHSSIMGDSFLRSYMDDLLHSLRTQVLTKLVTPYTRVSISYIAQELSGVSLKEVEDLLVSLILDGKLQAKIDQVQGYLVCVRVGTSGGGMSSTAVQSHVRNAHAMERWVEALRDLHKHVTSRSL